MPVADTRKYLDGLRSVLTRNIAENKYTRIPDLVNLRIQKLSPRAPEVRILKGKTWPTKGVAEGTRKLSGTSAKELVEKLVA